MGVDLKDIEEGSGLPTVFGQLLLWILKEGMISINSLRLPKVSVAPACQMFMEPRCACLVTLRTPGLVS